MISRDEHAAIIANQASRWTAYEAMHRAHFDSNKYVAVDSKGQSLGKFATNKAARMISNASSVRHEDYLTVKDKVTEIRELALNGISDLMSAGLSFSEDISKQMVGFENVTDFEDAQQDMNPTVTGNNDTNYKEDFVPLPITHSGFTVPWRQNSFDYKRSMGMSRAIRKVAERLEKTLFLGNSEIAATYNGANYPIYGYTTHPERGQGTISDWTTSANIGLVNVELNREIGLMWSDQGGVGPKSLVAYVAKDIWQNLQNDYKANLATSAYDRCLRIPQLQDIKYGSFLPDGEVVIVEMDARTIQLAVASDIIAVPHQKIEVFQPQAYTVYGAMTHCIKVDANDNTGIRHLTT